MLIDWRLELQYESLGIRPLTWYALWWRCSLKLDPDLSSELLFQSRGKRCGSAYLPSTPYDAILTSTTQLHQQTTPPCLRQPVYLYFNGPLIYASWYKVITDKNICISVNHRKGMWRLVLNKSINSHIF